MNHMAFFLLFFLNYTIVGNKNPVVNQVHICLTMHRENSNTYLALNSLLAHLTFKVNNKQTYVAKWAPTMWEN